MATMTTQAITARDGKFYAGMTRADAEKMDSKRNFLEKIMGKSTTTIFDEKDVNKDGVLDKYEICESLKDGSEQSFLGALFGGALCSFYGVKGLPSNKYLAIGMGALMIGGSLYLLIDGAIKGSKYKELVKQLAPLKAKENVVQETPQAAKNEAPQVAKNETPQAAKNEAPEKATKKKETKVKNEAPETDTKKKETEVKKQRIDVQS